MTNRESRKNLYVFCTRAICWRARATIFNIYSNPCFFRPRFIQIQINLQATSRRRPHGGNHIWRVPCSRPHTDSSKHIRLSAGASHDQHLAGYRDQRRERQQPADRWGVPAQPAAFRHLPTPTPSHHSVTWISARARQLNCVVIPICQHLMNARVLVVKVNRRESAITTLR